MYKQNHLLTRVEEKRETSNDSMSAWLCSRSIARTATRPVSYICEIHTHTHTHTFIYIYIYI